MNKNYLADNLRYLAEKKGVPLSTVARQCQLAPSAVLRLAKGEVGTPRISTVVRLAEYFEVNHVDLTSIDLSIARPADAGLDLFSGAPQAHKPEPARVKNDVALIQWGEAYRLAIEGKDDITDPADAISWVPEPPSAHLSQLQLVAVTAPSDTMAPRICSGDILYVKLGTKEFLKPYDIVLAEVGTDGAHEFSLGYVTRKSDEEMYLRPSEGWSDQTGGKPQRIRSIIGQVVGSFAVL